MEGFIAVIALVVVTFGVGIAVGADESRAQWEKDAIGRDFGLYCPNNAKFAWKGEYE